MDIPRRLRELMADPGTGFEDKRMLLYFTPVPLQNPRSRDLLAI